MSSGEADAYRVTITNTAKTGSNSNYYPHDTWTNPTTSTYSWSYTYPIYYYQVTCPKCKNTLWAEQDKITTCEGKLARKICGAKIKAVIEQVDYEIPVIKPK